MSGEKKVELPGHTEQVEMAFSDVFVNVSSNYFMAEVYLTNYRSACMSARCVLYSCYIFVL